MNNPFEYQNDLSHLNEDFTGIHQYYANKTQGLKEAALIKKGQDLAKQSAASVGKVSDIGHAVESFLGAGAAPSIVTKVIRPGGEAIARGVRAAGRQVSRLKSFTGRADEPADEGIELGGDETSAVGGDAPSVVRQVAAPAEEAAAPVEQTLQEREIDLFGRTDDPFHESNQPGYEPDERGGESKSGDMEDFDEPLQRGDIEDMDAAFRGDEAGYEAGETKTDDADYGADDAADAGDTAAEDAAADVGEDVGAEAGLDAAEAGVASAAASNFYDPLGWLLGAAALGMGIYSGIEAGEEGGKEASATASLVGDVPKYSPPPSFAGKYIVPVRNALTA